MRDPDRIPLLMLLITRYWKEKCPDWRFTQLMANFQRWYGSDAFYVEDDEFATKFAEFMEGIK